jgi:hypothetical protein
MLTVPDTIGSTVGKVNDRLCARCADVFDSSGHLNAKRRETSEAKKEAQDAAFHRFSPDDWTVQFSETDLRINPAGFCHIFTKNQYRSR